MQPYTYFDNASGLYLWVGGVSTVAEQQTIFTWVPPKGYTFMWITCVSGAGGGGGGAAAASGQASGGGGGAGVCSRVLIPTDFVGDRLVLYVGWGAPGGAGGVGAANGTVGSNGGASAVYNNYFDSTSSQNLICGRSASATGGTGGTGGAGASASGGSGQSHQSFTAIESFLIGTTNISSGGSGATTSAGTDFLQGWSSGGCGGGGVNGSNVASNGGFYTSDNTQTPVPRTALPGENGQDGLQMFLMPDSFWHLTGGAGGGGTAGTNAVGGNGGNGAMGCGGGGGGGASGTSATGGSGGAGGPGYILIQMV